MGQLPIGYLHPAFDEDHSLVHPFRVLLIKLVEEVQVIVRVVGPVERSGVEQGRTILDGGSYYQHRPECPQEDSLDGSNTLLPIRFLTVRFGSGETHEPVAHAADLVFGDGYSVGHGGKSTYEQNVDDCVIRCGGEAGCDM